MGRRATQCIVGLPHDPRRSTGETPFSLTYGAEAVIPTEVSLCSARVAGFDSVQNADLMMEHLD